MRVLDLFCGRWGWSRAFAARGWEVLGIDLIEPPEIPHGCRFWRMDVLEISKIERDDFDFICASSPCENFTLHQLKNFHPAPPYPELGIRLFNHTRGLCEASGVPYVMENVRSAQDFVGQADAHCESFYFWGNGIPPLLPKGFGVKGMKMGRKWCQELGGHGSSKRNSQTAGFATIPPELANCVATYAERLLEQAVTI